MLWGIIKNDIKYSKQAKKRDEGIFSFYLLKHINIWTSKSYSSHDKVALGQATSQTEDQDKNIDTLLLP